MNKVNRELKKLEMNPLDFATLDIREGTSIVDATLLGPEESPYDGGAFHLEITIPSNYPLVAPSVRFATKIYHPLVDKDDGRFCNEAIAESWKAVNNLTTVVTTVYEMLENYASCDMAVDPDIGDEVRNNREAFEATAKEWTEKYACFSTCLNKQYYYFIPSCCLIFCASNPLTIPYTNNITQTDNLSKPNTKFIL